MGLIAARDVSMTFGGFGRPETHALKGVSLALPDEPSIVAVVGQSGSGKTTLMRILLGLQEPTAGTVLYRGAPPGADPARFRREVQAVFQDPFGVFNPFYRVDRALVLPLMRFGLAGSKGEAMDLASRGLEAVGLRPAETLGRFPHQLSGGQRQRIMIARALLLKPQVLVADEPVSMVDASLRATILESLWKLKTERGISIVYVTHDLTTAYQIADRIVVMVGGEIVESGAPEAVIHSPSHPYTKALVGAVPPPDPSVDWGLEDETDEVAA
ncbi:ABC transporter ATP-binding protein [uncultured Alsobacter sp.]|uniref:ABC transporter ATP-binding protein n=1 Tax=uncultured Alsobacter sp. TaxID=1748258 RepID=UPI0025DEF8D8|nr:ATP-binding cassette domain-containing protein [uncultured Alsobacter sp.]